MEGERGGFFFSSRRRHTRWPRDWSSDVCSSDLEAVGRAEVDHPVCGALLTDLRVVAGHVRIVEPDVAVARAPDDDAPLVERVPLAVDRQRRRLPLDA